MKIFLCRTALCAAALTSACAYSQDHAFSVKDDIAMVRFSDPRPTTNLPGSEFAQESPDGRFVAVVTSKGRLASDQIESTLSIFETEKIAAFLKGDLTQAPSPRTIARVVSFPHRDLPTEYAAVIQDLCWSLDGTALYFKGENTTGAYQIFEAKLDGSGFHALTPPEQSVSRFGVTRNVVVYSASKVDADRTIYDDVINADAQRWTGHSLERVLFSTQPTSLVPETFTVSVRRTVGDQSVTTHVPGFSFREIPHLSGFYPFAPSPKGDKLIVMTPVLSVPEAWKNYEPALGLDHLRLTSSNPRNGIEELLRPERYSLIDLLNGKSTPLFDAPNAKVLIYLDPNRLAWAADESRVLVTNTFLPPSDEPRSADTHDIKPCAVASVDLPSLVTHCFFYETKDQQLADMHVLDVAFGKNNEEALVLSQQGTKAEFLQRYQLENGQWHLTTTNAIATPTARLADLHSVAGRSAPDLQISIRQSYNDPPTLWASDSKVGRTRQLWDPNPQFAHMQFGEAAHYVWKDKTGRDWDGILVTPVHYVPGKKYPLVLQMYSFVENGFVTDGLYPTAFAARHLASAGFVVLQIRKKPSQFLDTDAQDHLEGYRSAIESLDEAGLIDRTRVGVVGFSWTCWYVANALVKQPDLFAAATIAEGLDNSYMQYLLTAEHQSSIQEQMRKIRGTEPFGPGLKRWVEDAPGFNLDKVRTPVRIEASGLLSALQEWELYASLYSQHKPVDLIYFPHGTHIHQKPLERLESQQGNVDWLRFWLQRYEDPDPAKRAQYELWRSWKNAQSSSSTIATSN